MPRRFDTVCQHKRDRATPKATGAKDGAMLNASAFPISLWMIANCRDTGSRRFRVRASRPHGLCLEQLDPLTSRGAELWILGMPLEWHLRRGQLLHHPSAVLDCEQELQFQRACLGRAPQASVHQSKRRRVLRGPRERQLSLRAEERALETQPTRRWRFFHACMIMYLLLTPVLLFTGGPPADVGKGINLIPFRTIEQTLAVGSSRALLLLALNLALLMPLGAALALRRTRFNLIVVILIVLGVGVAIETTQFLLPGARSTDVDDLILNLVGGLSAYGVVALLVDRRRRPGGAAGHEAGRSANAQPANGNSAANHNQDS